jgi:hypothetical protein
VLLGELNVLACENLDELFKPRETPFNVATVLSR